MAARLRFWLGRLAAGFGCWVRRHLLSGVVLVVVVYFSGRGLFVCLFVCFLRQAGRQAGYGMLLLSEVGGLISGKDVL